MATVHVLSFSLIDDGGNTGSVVVYLPSTLTLAQVQTFTTSYAAALDGVTGAKIQSATVALALTLPGGLKANASADHPIQYGANFSYNADGTPYRLTQHIPAFLHTLITGEEIDIASALVIAVMDYMRDGVTGFEPTDRYGNDLEGFLGAAVSFRKG